MSSSLNIEWLEQLRMVPRKFVTDTTGWYRIGSGLRLDFNATDDEFADTLLVNLLPQYAAYRLVSTECRKQGKYYFWYAHEHDPCELKQLCQLGVESFFIRSLAIHPKIDWDQTKDPDGACSLNGMVHLRQGHTGPFRHASIGIVWKVFDENSNRAIEHTEYREIFDALRKGFRKFKNRPPLDG